MMAAVIASLYGLMVAACRFPRAGPSSHPTCASLWWWSKER